MQDDRRWLKHPVLPRPPALPHFGPEMRALIGLDPSDLEKDAPSVDANAAHVEGEAEAQFADTEPDALASGTFPNARAVRTGT
jgi:hypothetical protein